MKKSYFLSAILGLVLQCAFAQCPPPGFPESGNTCPQAPILCENLDGYCNTINNNNQQQNFPGCNNSWTLNNDEWFAFYAGTTSISIQVTPSNCTANGSNTGLQGGIYHGCGGPVMDVQCSCTEDPFVLTSNNYVVGDIYWFVLDGCAGDVCDYSIAVIEGSTVGAPPEDPGDISGTSPVCGGASSVYSVPPVSGASNYNWTLTPPGIGTMSGGNDQTVNVQWNNSGGGMAELCLQVANACYPNPTISCQTVEIIPKPTAALSGSGALCSGPVNLSISFTGMAPWSFIPVLNGVSQAPIQTSDNPYDFQVNQVGTWSLLGVGTVGFNCLGTVSGSVTVALDSLTATSSTLSAVCGQNNGSIDLSVMGSNPSYTYHWSNDSTTQDLNLIPGGTYTVTITGDNGCVGTHVATVENTMKTDTIAFCQGDSILIGGQYYTGPATVLDTMNSTACDSIVQYVLTLLPLPEYADTITFCPGASVVIGGQTYTEAGAVIDTIPGTTGCDTLVHYTLMLLPQPTKAQNIAFCPGESVVIAGQTYTQAGTVFDTIPGITGCDTIVQYTLIQLVQPTSTQTIELCPGESVVLGGQTYSGVGTVKLTVPATSGCDTIVTYIFQSVLPAASNVTIQCPQAISIIAEPGTAPLVVDYNLPTATSDCPCPGLTMNLTAGLPSGALFPNAITQVCYTATDVCGQSASCCFNVTVREIQPCDVKVNGCIRYELLSITADPEKNQTYRIRVVNNCSNKLIYTAIQQPSGTVAIEPANFSVFTTESGRDYDVRNPNFTPFYSIRYKSIDDSIANGASDIFRYTLAAQSDPDYIDITSRLYPQIFVEAHLNTFYCPVGVTKPENRDGLQSVGVSNLKLFPNPTTGVLWVDASELGQTPQQWHVLNSQGQELVGGTLTRETELQRIDIPLTLANGLFFFEMRYESGERELLRFVLQR